MIKPLPVYGNCKSQPNTNVSTSISLSIVDEKGDEVSFDQPIEVIIPHDSNVIIPSMIVQNVTTFNNQLFAFHPMNLSQDFSVSAHLEVRPLDISVAYLLVYRFDGVPQVNHFDGWTRFCPLSKSFCSSVELMELLFDCRCV